MAVALIRWTEESTYEAYVEVPEGFDAADYDVENDLAEINEDIHHIGTDRIVDEVKIVTEVPPNEEVEEIEWTRL